MSTREQKLILKGVAAKAMPHLELEEA